MKRRAAYFMSTDAFLGRPFDDAVIRSLADAGFDVDIFVPARGGDRAGYGPEINLRPVEYRMSWLAKNILRRTWRQYELFLGNADLPMAFAGVLAARARRKSVTVCDEVFIGEYAGNARLYWKSLAQLAMRRARFTVITDPCRNELQQQYAGLRNGHEFFCYPSCFRDRRHVGTREVWRHKLGVDSDTVLLSFSGFTSDLTGIHWAIRALNTLPDRFKLLLQPGPQSEMVSALIEHAAPRGRIICVPGREPSYVNATSVNLASDIGLVFYLSSSAAFKAMGMSSNKLCMYLQMGLPVVVNSLASFRFIEEYGAGILVDSEDQVPGALAKILDSYPAYAAGATRCYEEHIRPAARARELTARFLAL